jgi:signal transduction histidine kinase
MPTESVSQETGIAERPRGKPPASIRSVSIERRVYLVGAVPIIVAVAIGIVSLYLVSRADGARLGAHAVATAFRHVVTATSQRDAFISAPSSERDQHLRLVLSSVDAAAASIASLVPARLPEIDEEAVSATGAELSRYRSQMLALAPAVARSDQLLAQMDERLATLLTLTDEARQRQHASNADLVGSLRKRDLALQAAQIRLGQAQQARAAIVDHALVRDTGAATALATARVTNATEALAELLDEEAETTALGAAVAVYLEGGPVAPVFDIIDRRIKIDGTATRSLQSEVSELLAYTVEAHETEQATQNIAVETIKLAERATGAVDQRNLADIAAVASESIDLGERIASLPIAPLIQTEMLDALDLWREGLEEARSGLSEQEEALSRMNGTADNLVFEVATLNRELSSRADATGAAARQILVFGAGIALFAAAFFGLVVGRSITRPIKRLEQGMLHRAAHPEEGPLRGARRRDEIGMMTRATNQFLSELGKRETALRAAKERTEEALTQLKRAQRELIQSEKLASLGQLVAGVAHEINTPLGVALTTTSVLREEVGEFERLSKAQGLTRQGFASFLDRMTDGMRLTVSNLERAARLVASFKQVAADQASGDRRTLLLDGFLQEVFTSLGPLGRKGAHHVEIVCPPGLELDTYPGALAQVLTNLLTNAYTHAFARRTGGRVRVEVTQPVAGEVRVAFSDDGCGIAPDMCDRIFDPFFTTGRAQGSTGLGLHIVHNIVTGVLGGRIATQSSVGRGTTFVIDLPKVRPSPSNQQETSS